MGKLHDRMQEDLLLKAYSPYTQKAHLRCARHFVSHYMRSPEEMGEQEIRSFLLRTCIEDFRTFCPTTPNISQLTPALAEAGFSLSPVRHNLCNYLYALTI
jgi:hypothetical protein